MLPEISRRCLSCGASVRAEARFCQQCGEKVGGGSDEVRVDTSVEERREARENEGQWPAAAGEDFALKETWREWEHNIGSHAGEAATGEPSDAETAVGGEKEAPSGILRRPRANEAGVVKESEEKVEKANRDADAGLARPARADERAAPSSIVVPHAGTTDEIRTSEPAAGVSQSAATGGESALASGRRAAAVRESLRPRVERVRDASLGVLEEASEDTGLRFVLISIVLFLLFLFFLILSYALK